ncbi:MAG: nucleoside triphosphate pyrophosphohydrolase [Gammaproteobacteria bacterium]|nr:nucleoside triphosphate pyrophosphohydrolase [Gammaproteobacteria bacterium]
MTDNKSINNLLGIMRALRDPQTGCSWDKVQTFETIVPYTIEEAYEVAEAISRNDMDDLCDELGDLLLQVVYHAQIAQEKNQFSFDDVVNAICEKMLRRHPHVFGSDVEVLQGKQDWEQFKQQERLVRGKTEEDSSVLANVAEGLPPLIRARKLQKKAAKVNFDWSDVAGVIAKLKEEVGELEQSIKMEQGSVRVEEEMGDVLFSVVNLCRHVSVDADVVLQKSNSKFESRFRLVEYLVSEQGKNMTDLKENELDQCWRQAKKMLSVK